jgi:succinyl-CoA synthetase beta subunit
VKIHEYQAKALLAEFGIPIPRGDVATTPAEVREIASRLGGRVVIKVQVYAGGRGKAGGIRIAGSPEEAESLAVKILGRRLVTYQTAAEGIPVSKVLVEEVVDGEHELYLSILVDGTSQLPVMLATEAGGVEIEEVARDTPQKILRAYIDPATGFQPFQGRRLSYGMNISQDLVPSAVKLMSHLYRLFHSRDCSLAEINPLAVTPDGQLLALDAKLNFDDNALFRHGDIEELRDPEQEDPLEVRAVEYGIRNYIKLEGDIGCMVNGAGLAMSVMDLITLAGGKPANFLDIGTSNTTARVVQAFKIFTADPGVKAVLVNIFGGIARVDVIARGIVEAYQQMDIFLPVVVRLAGTGAEEGQRILSESGIDLIRAADFRDAAEKVVKAARGERD